MHESKVDGVKILTSGLFARKFITEFILIYIEATQLHCVRHPLFTLYNKKKNNSKTFAVKYQFM